MLFVLDHDCNAVMLVAGDKSGTLMRGSTWERRYRKAVSEVESGDVRSLKVDTLERYAKALGGSFLAYIQVGDKSVRLA